MKPENPSLCVGCEHPPHLIQCIGDGDGAPICRCTVIEPAARGFEIAARVRLANWLGLFARISAPVDLSEADMRTVIARGEQFLRDAEEVVGWTWNLLEPGTKEAATLEDFDNELVAAGVDPVEVAAAAHHLTVIAGRLGTGRAALYLSSLLLRIDEMRAAGVDQHAETH